ncbi:hypothetical protein LguiA_012052 [Lonicera macranthoides]
MIRIKFCPSGSLFVGSFGLVGTLFSFDWEPMGHAKVVDAALGACYELNVLFDLAATSTFLSPPKPNFPSSWTVLC